MMGRGMLALLTMLLLCGCRRNAQEAAVPKPDAWPRWESAEPEYGKSVGGFLVNSRAEVSAQDSAGWTLVSYPDYGTARIFMTRRRVAPTELAEAVGNRIERMALNTGGATSRLTELSGPFECRVLHTPSGTETPLQFLAYSRSGEIYTGTLMIDGAARAEADSFAPIVAAVERDVIHALKHLK